MCSFAKSPVTKLCKKPQYRSIAPKKLPEKAASQTPQYLSAHQNKAAYQTPKYFQLPKKNDGKMLYRTTNYIFFGFDPPGGTFGPTGRKRIFRVKKLRLK